MAASQVAPYGAWRSPITSDLIVRGAVGLTMIKLDGDDIYWIEVRPSEAGRSVVVRRDAAGQTRDITPAPFNVRTRVHEYGGGDYCVHEGHVYFANFADQRLYHQAPGDTEPASLTPDGVDLRYADMLLDTAHACLICVREDHSAAPEHEAVNTLVSLKLDGTDGGGRVLASGYDFYSSPRLSPDGRRLAWLCWNHPNMPWDGCELWVAEVTDDGTLGQMTLVAGGTDESIFQPEWSPVDGALHFISDRSGWWNLYRAGRAADAVQEIGAHVAPLYELAAEFGQPQWGFGMSTYALPTPTQIVCTYRERGLARLALLDTTTRQLEPLETPYTDISYLRATPQHAVFLAGRPDAPAAAVRLDLATRERTVLRRANDTELDPGYLSTAQPIEFPTEAGLTAHAFYYPPRNRDFAAPTGERPPLLVKSHGGPTAAASAALSLGIQYWTSRGFAVLDVNYGGSTGYGREYRRRLNDQWGIVDVDDCVNGARHLIAQGLVDGARCVIDGGSAGGYTTLAALTFRNLFRAGASHYGVSDLGALVRDTHKFESRYLDRLIGPYPARADIYHARSPINFTAQLSCPVIFFQGLEDKVVPPNQAELMVDALRQKGLPVAYVPFAGEQHGFRRAENIKRALDGELYFYARVFNFPLADPVEPVPIENL
ncbi:MAG TPA: S9 family peptidase [Pyrinomonadaceae bacterium]|jgi:dipeptidyl aminopeptidase/acylaminoacyl peptidase